MFNPFARFRITGSWLDHVGVPAYPARGSTGYSSGGIDWPCPMGTPVLAPAAGYLRTSGGSGEFAAGWVGSAGRRSILMLNEPIRDLVAIVFQHQSAFGVARFYGERQQVGLSGASANGVERGGDVHMHSHGLTAGGKRINWLDYLPAATAATGTEAIPESTPIRRNRMQLIAHRVGANLAYYIASETQLIGPIVMGAERLAGVVAAYGPAREVLNDGILGVQDVIETNNTLNKKEGVYDFDVKYSDGFKPPLSTVLHSIDSKLDRAATGGIDLDALAAKVAKAMPGGASAAEVANELQRRLIG